MPVGEDAVGTVSRLFRENGVPLGDAGACGERRVMSGVLAGLWGSGGFGGADR